MRTAAILMAIVLSAICLYWTLGYIWRRSRARRRS
jgi:hypothetical protein